MARALKNKYILRVDYLIVSALDLNACSEFELISIVPGPFPQIRTWLRTNVITRLNYLKLNDRGVQLTWLSDMFYDVQTWLANCLCTIGTCTTSRTIRVAKLETSFGRSITQMHHNWRVRNEYNMNYIHGTESGMWLANWHNKGAMVVTWPDHNHVELTVKCKHSHTS